MPSEIRMSRSIAATLYVLVEPACYNFRACDAEIPQNFQGAGAGFA